MTLYNAAFYVCMFFLIVSVVIGLASVWFEDVWKNSISWKLLATSVILFSGSFACAMVTKWLG